MRKLIIFDFDGVLVDSFDAWHKINVYAFKKALGKNFTKEQYRDCYIDDLNKGLEKFAGSKKNYQKLKVFKKARGEELFFKYYSRVKLFPFVKSLVFQLEKHKVKPVIITSSTNPAFVVEMLRKFKLDKNFAVSLSSKGGSKVTHLKEVLRKFNFKPTDVYFVTDTYNDIKWGKEVGLKTIAVLWGYHGKQVLKRAKPDFIIKDYQKIFSIIKI